MSSSTARRAMPLVAAALLLIGSLGTAGTASATLTYDPAMPNRRTASSRSTRTASARVTSRM